MAQVSPERSESSQSSSVLSQVVRMPPLLSSAWSAEITRTFPRLKSRSTAKSDAQRTKSRGRFVEDDLLVGKGECEEGRPQGSGPGDSGPREASWTEAWTQEGGHRDEGRPNGGKEAHPPGRGEGRYAAPAQHTDYDLDLRLLLIALRRLAIYARRPGGPPGGPPWRSGRNAQSRPAGRYRPRSRISVLKALRSPLDRRDLAKRGNCRVARRRHSYTRRNGSQPRRPSSCLQRCLRERHRPIPFPSPRLLSSSALSSSAALSSFRRSI